jgi:hypothetical protein
MDYYRGGFGFGIKDFSYGKNIRRCNPKVIRIVTEAVAERASI